MALYVVGMAYLCMWDCAMLESSHVMLSHCCDSQAATVQRTSIQSKCEQVENGTMQSVCAYQVWHAANLGG